MKNELLDAVNFLIEDEKEAIEGYNEKKDLFKDYPDIIERIDEIIGDEEDHIARLEEIKVKIILRAIE